MTLDVHPESLRTVGRSWHDAAGAAQTHGETLISVGAGGHQFGRINQFLVPALAGFVALARLAALAHGKQWEEGAVALRQTALDLELTDGDVARLMSGDTAVLQMSGATGLWA